MPYACPRQVDATASSLERLGEAGWLQDVRTEESLAGQACNQPSRHTTPHMDMDPMDMGTSSHAEMRGQEPRSHHTAQLALVGCSHRPLATRIDFSYTAWKLKIGARSRFSLLEADERSLRPILIPKTSRKQRVLLDSPCQRFNMCVPESAMYTVIAECLVTRLSRCWRLEAQRGSHQREEAQRIDRARDAVRQTAADHVRLP